MYEGNLALRTLKKSQLFNFFEMIQQQMLLFFYPEAQVQYYTTVICVHILGVEIYVDSNLYCVPFVFVCVLQSRIKHTLLTFTQTHSTYLGIFVERKKTNSRLCSTSESWNWCKLCKSIVCCLYKKLGRTGRPWFGFWLGDMAPGMMSAPSGSLWLEKSTFVECLLFQHTLAKKGTS